MQPGTPADELGRDALAVSAPSAPVRALIADEADRPATPHSEPRQAVSVREVDTREGRERGVAGV